MFGLFQQLQSFYQRRIQIPVNSSDLVLDIGSGDKPHWRADILLDEFVSKKDGIQRSGSSDVAVPKPLVVAAMESMPFKDKAFDYVVCSHVLEHVIDPAKAIKEMMRIAKAGYIEVPFEGAAKIIDVPSHLWYCRWQNNQLIFTAKKSVAYDEVIDQLMSTKEMLYGFAALGQKYWEKFIVEIRWKKNIRFVVKEKASKKIFLDAQKAEIIHNKQNFLLRNITNLCISLLFWNKKLQRKIDLQDIMQCNHCKNAVSKKGNFFICQKCHNKIQVIGI